MLELPAVRPLAEHDARHIGDFKDGTFGLSYLGFLLYCNGKNPRGLSARFPKGLLYFDGENIFGIGVFRREGEAEGGHLMAVAPRGLDPIGALERFSASALAAAPQLQGKLLYARFLKHGQYRQLLAQGYYPAQEHPWHDEAFAEDETYNHAVIRLSDAFEYSESIARQQKPFPKSYWNRSALARFSNFLSRQRLKWQWGDYDAEAAKKIVGLHFRMLEERGGRGGSLPEGYWNVLEKPYAEKFSVIGRLEGENGGAAVSAFVGEKTAEDRLALYCCISRRTPDLLAELGLPEKCKGFGALSTFALLSVFAEIKRRMPEIEEIDLGGSETADLNAFKRRLGARNNPSYWVVKRLG